MSGFDELIYRVFRVLVWVALAASALVAIKLRIELAILLWIVAALLFAFSIWVRESSPHYQAARAMKPSADRGDDRVESSTSENLP